MDDFAYKWPYTYMTQPRDARVDRLNTLSALSAQVETLSKKLDTIAAQRTRRVAVTCDYCAGNHPSHQCTISFRPGQYGGDYLNNYAYPNYHQDWGYHPDSSWSFNQQDQFYAPSPTYAPEFSCPPPLPQEENSGLEKFMSKIIADQEETMRSQEISRQNLNKQMEQLINASTNGPQYMDSETETENSRLEELCSKYVASNEERMIEQAKSSQNLHSQLDQMFESLNNCPQNNWCYDMYSETDGEPEPNMQLDTLQKDEREETIGKEEKDIGKDPNVSYNEDEPIVLESQVSSPPRFKAPVRFAKPCPLGSHVIDKALYDIRASATAEPWWDEEERIEEEPIVFDNLQCPKLITDTMEKAPSYATFKMGDLSTKSKLGDIISMAISNGNLPKHTLLMMDGGFLNYRRGIG